MTAIRGHTFAPINITLAIAAIALGAGPPRLRKMN
jgi:hypothetical protein